MKLLEILEKPLEYEVTRDGPKLFEAKFTAGDRDIVFSATYSGGSFWEISFSELNGNTESTMKTGSGNEFAVFATVKAILQEFIERYKPYRLTIDSHKGEGNRTRLYQRMISKNLPTGWKVERDENHPSYTTFNLSRT